MRAVHWWLPVVLVCLLGMAALAQERGRRRSRAGEAFRTDVAAAAYDIVLARPRANGITVSVRVSKDCEAALEYGAESGRYTLSTPFAPMAAAEPRELEIEGLAARTRYFYRLKTREPESERFETSAELSFRTGRHANEPFTFTVQADSHLDANTDPELYGQSLARVLESSPDFHVDLGDTFMTDKRGVDFRQT